MLHFRLLNNTGCPQLLKNTNRLLTARLLVQLDGCLHGQHNLSFLGLAPTRTNKATGAQAERRSCLHRLSADGRSLRWAALFRFQSLSAGCLFDAMVTKCLAFISLTGSGCALSLQAAHMQTFSSSQEAKSYGWKKLAST